jgi:hypothetical protein
VALLREPAARAEGSVGEGCWQTTTHDMENSAQARPTPIQLVEHLDGAIGPAIFAHACKLGCEGVVSKQRDLGYRRNTVSHQNFAVAHQLEHHA